MKRPLILLLLLLVSGAIAHAKEAAHGWCEMGNNHVVTSGLQSTTVVQRSFPSCVITVYIHGAGLATIFADNNGTPLANPFVSQSDGQFIFYAADGKYDVTMTSAGFPQPITYSDILLCDPFVAGAVCSGAASGAHNLLSTTHLDTIPFSPPVRGDVITAQNQTSPTSVNPSWARLPLGTNGQVLTSNGIDAIWAPVAAGSGCTVGSLLDQWVVSIHPNATCYGSTDWTWDDTNQNMQAGDGSTTLSLTNTNTFTWGVHNALTDATNVNIEGNHNTILCDANTVGTTACAIINVIGASNNITNTGASSIGFNQYQFARNSAITATGASTASYIMQLLSNNTVSSTLAGTMNVLFQAGQGNTASAVGPVSITSSTFQIGESIQATSSAGGNVDDNIQLGESLQLNAANASSLVQFSAQLGYNDSITSTAGHSVTYGWQIGHTNTNTASSANMTDFGMIGKSNSLQNCSDCYVFGENTGTTTTGHLVIGYSVPPEIDVSVNHVALSGHIDQSATKNFAGTCAMSTGTSCTFTLLVAYSGTPICISAVQSATVTGGASGCTVSGTTVTITAANSNSSTWGAVLIGNPN